MRPPPPPPTKASSHETSHRLQGAQCNALSEIVSRSHRLEGQLVLLSSVLVLRRLVDGGGAHDGGPGGARGAWWGGPGGHSWILLAGIFRVAAPSG